MLPFAALFIFISLAAVGMQIRDAAVPSLLFGLVLLVIAAYLLFGAPHLVRAVSRRHSNDN